MGGKIDWKKEKMDTAKERIQNELQEKMGLIVDVPKAGTGTSNNGNTAQRLFQNPELISETTRVDNKLVRRFSMILQAIASKKR